MTPFVKDAFLSQLDHAVPFTCRPLCRPAQIVISSHDRVPQTQTTKVYNRSESNGASNLVSLAQIAARGGFDELAIADSTKGMLSYPIRIVGCHAQIPIYVYAAMHVRCKGIKQAARYDEKENRLRRRQSYFVLSAQDWKHRGHTPNPDRKRTVGILQLLRP